MYLKNILGKLINPIATLNVNSYTDIMSENWYLTDLNIPNRGGKWTYFWQNDTGYESVVP